MKSYKFLFALLAMPFLLLYSCNKENDMNDDPVYYMPVAAEREEIIDIPQGLQDLAGDGDFNAVSAIVYMNQANILSVLASSFMLPQDANLLSRQNNNYVYYWSFGGYSYWMTYSILADKYTWRYEYEFPEIPRFTYIYAEESKTGKNGFWSIHNADDPDKKIWNYEWSIDPQNNFSAIIKLNDTNEGAEAVFEVVNNADKSGSFIHTIANITQTEVFWNADGSGNYLIREGEEEKTGFWN